MRDGRLYSVTTVTIDGDRISGIFTLLNPDKLDGLM
jgi:hypothetical protein